MAKKRKIAITTKQKENIKVLAGFEPGSSSTRDGYYNHYATAAAECTTRSKAFISFTAMY